MYAGTVVECQSRKQPCIFGSIADEISLGGHEVEHETGGVYLIRIATLTGDRPLLDPHIKTADLHSKAYSAAEGDIGDTMTMKHDAPVIAAEKLYRGFTRLLCFAQHTRQQILSHRTLSTPTRRKRKDRGGNDSGDDVKLYASKYGQRKKGQWYGWIHADKFSKLSRHEQTAADNYVLR